MSNLPEETRAEIIAKIAHVEGEIQTIETWGATLAALDKERARLRIMLLSADAEYITELETRLAKLLGAH